MNWVCRFQGTFLTVLVLSFSSVDATVVSGQQNGRAVLSNVLEYRNKMSRIAAHFDRAIGAVDWPESAKQSNRFDLWSDFTSDRHRIDLNLSGFREVYCRNCQNTAGYFEYLEAPGSNSAKFDAGTIAPRFILDFRRFGVHCERASWLTLGDPSDDFPVLMTQGHVVASAEIPEEIRTRIRRDARIRDNHELMLLSFEVASNSRQTVIVDIDAGPSVIWSEIVTDVRDATGAVVVCRDEMCADLSQWDSEWWYPKRVTFSHFYGDSLNYTEQVSVTQCSFAAVTENTFTLQGVALRDGTIISGLEGQEMVEYRGGELVRFRNAIDLAGGSETKDSHSTWGPFVAVNVIAAAVISLMIVFKRRSSLRQVAEGKR